jgi:uncharacterized membrane protein
VLIRIIRITLLILMASLFAFSGTMHFLHPAPFLKIMPSYLPSHELLVCLSGCLEILGAILLLIPQTRTFAGIGLILLLIAVFPANINMAVNKINFGWIPEYALWLRLPLQLVMIWACWWTAIRANSNCKTQLRQGQEINDVADCSD